MKRIRMMVLRSVEELRHSRQLAGRAVWATGALMLMAMSAQAMADYVTFPVDGSGVLPNLSFAASLSTPRDNSVGNQLQSVALNPGLRASTTCSVQKNATVNGTPVPGDPMTFQTSVPGIGVRFYVTDQWSGVFRQAPFSETLPSTTSTTGHYTQANLVVTGPVGSGTLTTLPSMTVTFSGSCIPTTTVTQYLTPGTVITANTCTVTTTSIAVTLPQARASAMPTIGSTTGATPFSIGLSNCSAGLNVKLTMTDASNVSNTSTTLGLASGSTAAGVGLQILHGATPVAYGPDSGKAGNTNQWSAGVATGGSMTIPLTVQYVRTSSSLTPGTVSGIATFTMSYQ